MRKPILAAVAVTIVLASISVLPARGDDGVEPVLKTYTGQTSITYTNGNVPMAIQAIRVVSPVSVTVAVNLVNSGYTMPLVAASTNTVFAYTAGDTPLHMIPGGKITVGTIATNATTFQLYRVPVRYSN